MRDELVIAELWLDGECCARWTDQDGPPDLKERVPLLQLAGWTVHDFRDAEAAASGPGLAATP